MGQTENGIDGTETEVGTAPDLGQLSTRGVDQPEVPGMIGDSTDGSGRECQAAPARGDIEIPDAAPGDEPEQNDRDGVLTLADLAAALEQLAAKSDRLERLFENKITADEKQQAMINRLHDELQQYKDDLVLKIFRPFALDLISLHDDIGKIAASHRERLSGADAAESLLDEYGRLQEDLEDILFKHGFESYQTEDQRFDPRRQRVLRPLPTQDSELDRIVAARVRKGFSFGERIIRPEMVEVYRLEAGGHQANDGNSEEENGQDLRH